MAKLNWDEVAKEEFFDMNQTYQDDWRELYDRIN
jgi:hypothetical protein